MEIIGENETALSNRWAEKEFKKDALLSLNVDLNDNFVYKGEFIS